jgi:hypothetical protein
MKPRRSLVAEANTRVPFHTAAGWAQVGSGSARERGEKTWCPYKCSTSKSLRVFSDHGWCFSCRAYLPTVSLLAAVWELDAESAAKAALDKIGYVPVTYAHLWEHSLREQPPDLDALAQALRVWCEASDPGWARRQYLAPVSNKLSQCLSLLPRVKNEHDCDTWLAACKKAMAPLLHAGEPVHRSGE